MGKPRMREMDVNEWIFIKKKLFDEIRGKWSRMYIDSFILIAGFTRYATTSNAGLIKFDDRRHLHLFCSRMGIARYTFTNLINFLIRKGVLKKKGMYEYRLNLGAVKFTNVLPAEPGKKEEMGEPPIQEMYDWLEGRSRVEWKRFILNEEREEFLLLLKEEFCHLC
jgi:hypothetical protein